MAFKRKNEDAASYPALKRGRMMQLSCTSFEDAEETSIALGTSFRQKLKRKHEVDVRYSEIKKCRNMELPNTSLEDAVEIDDDVLVLDTDEDLIKEMDELLKDLML
jgi:hypothetical protein